MLDPRLHKKSIEQYTSECAHLGTSLRPVRIEDAEFILSLRTDINLNRFISSTSASVGNQRQWISDYLARYDAGQEAYFVIINGGRPRGTIRIYNYNITTNAVTYGSWLLGVDSPASCAFSSTILNHDLCFKALRFSRINFEVRKENLSVWKFHESIGAEFIIESENDRFYEITDGCYPPIRAKLEKLAQKFYERPIS